MGTTPSEPCVLLAPTPGADQISVRIVQGVAQLTGRDPEDLPVLESFIDTDALENLFEAARPRSTDPIDSLSFEYAGCHVVVNADDTVFVQLHE
jgi:hypothetical protein